MGIMEPMLESVESGNEPAARQQPGASTYNKGRPRAADPKHYGRNKVQLPR